MSGILEAANRISGIETRVISYVDYLSGIETEVTANDVVRIESPGESAEIERLILRAGIAPMEALGRIPLREPELDQRPFGRGEIHHPWQWFLGFRRVLQRLEATWGAAGPRWMTSPAEIATMFDKVDCRNRWSAAGLPVPPSYPGVENYAQLRATITERHRRLFIKLRYGFSAIGAVALEWRGPLVRALTTVESVWSQGRRACS